MTTLTPWQVKQLFENLDNAQGVMYDAKDNLQNPLQCLRVLELQGQTKRYAGVYHVPTKVDNDQFKYSVHLATSNDLTSWAHQKLLVDNADMPYIYRAHPAGQPSSPSSWILLVHEQWEGPGPASTAPCQLGFKLFYNDADLLQGEAFFSWTAPRSLSALEGTPNVYKAFLNLRGGYWSLDAIVGFHFNNDDGRDVVAQSYLKRLGDPRPEYPPVWEPAPATQYTDNITRQGATGNVGQRDSNVGQSQPSPLSGRYSLQEGNIQGPPIANTVWEAWRLWLYDWGQDPPDPWPVGNGKFYPVQPRTPNGSFAFGNPGFHILTSPDGQGKCLFVSYFLFQEGTAPDDHSGALIFHKPIP